MTAGNSKTIRVEYFATLREESGCSEEDVVTAAGSALELFEELRARYGFTLDSPRLKVVVNEEFCDWSRAVEDGDTVVFVPPVAGG